VPLIPAPPAPPDKETLALRVDRDLHEQLRAYAEFLGSTKEYIVTSALRRVFRYDKDFIAWQQARHASEPNSAAAQNPASLRITDDMPDAKHADTPRRAASRDRA
jgi:predicted transcriptional regulator